MPDAIYQPKPGDPVLVTVYAVTRERGGYNCTGPDFDDSKPDPFGFGPTAPCIARVAPAPVELPTGFGARIRATLTWNGGNDFGETYVARGVVLCRVGDDTCPWKPAPNQPNLHAGHYFRDGHLSDVVILDRGEPM